MIAFDKWVARILEKIFREELIKLIGPRSEAKIGFGDLGRRTILAQLIFSKLAECE